MKKSIFITGASSGIGRALGFEMAKRNYDLALTARRYDRLEKIRDEILSRFPDRTVAIERLDVIRYAEIPHVLEKMAATVNSATT